VSPNYGLPDKLSAPLPAYVPAAYSFTGLDGPAHMAEESSNAAIANPNGIMAGVYFMVGSGQASNLDFGTSVRIHGCTYQGCCKMLGLAPLDTQSQTRADLSGCCFQCSLSAHCTHYTLCRS
jgi:hypothetical protein